ncbi:PREDICTED: deoxynucleotidyltransferase terminal-interacting protein 2 [Dufourea novaeangliae]|uniref:Deoxynucleotidyltransferase terminal-interacting protein 2 n=1 Tax=Dufourea novaeangliae TaxID=178035 RepID=A0A154PJ59_DUFNO|nr:PREDICTED: deoxynucleotidyltransferase terminal-interacting protein 2 [Dufourea novaeangliae]KZC11494.1 Deoxynucleotidyltransferase terminal-interacting protein 2 [Dufourea novaeangliae]
MDIIIDTTGDAELATRNNLVESDEDDLDFENPGTQSSIFFNIEEDLIQNNAPTKKKCRDVTKDIDLEEFENDMGWAGPKKKHHKTSASVALLTKDITAVDKLLKKSVVQPGFEQLDAVPPYEVSKRQLQIKRRKERAETKGKAWFNMRPPEMTPEVKHDLEVLQMRSALDPKHFYKKNDLKVIPKYFQIGKVVDSPLDYYSGRLTKKERKNTIVDELMADAEFSKYNKRKYKEIIEEKKKLHYKAHKHAKRLKGKKK